MQSSGSNVTSPISLVVSQALEMVDTCNLMESMCYMSKFDSNPFLCLLLLYYKNIFSVRQVHLELSTVCLLIADILVKQPYLYFRHGVCTP